MALAMAWAAPRRTRAASPRAPAARPKASRMIDLPAPVSPVNAVRPGPNERSRLSMRTTSRMARPISMAPRMTENPRGSKPQNVVQEIALLGRLRGLGGRRDPGHLGAVGHVHRWRRNGRLLVPPERQEGGDGRPSAARGDGRPQTLGGEKPIGVAI